MLLFALKILGNVNNKKKNSNRYATIFDGKKKNVQAVAPCKRGIRFCENPSSGDVETVSKKLFQITTGTSVKHNGSLTRSK